MSWPGDAGSRSVPEPAPAEPSPAAPPSSGAPPAEARAAAADPSGREPAPLRLVMGAANYWGSPITTGSQHYARLFAGDGWRVAYLSDQISPLHLLRLKSRAYTADKFRLWLRGGARDVDGRLWAYNHLTLLPVFGAPVLRSEFVARRALDWSLPSLFRKLVAEGFDRADVLWVDHLVHADLVGRLPAGASVYRMADDPRLFPEAYPPPLLARAERLLREADLIVVTAGRLFESVRRVRREGVIYLPNGVDYDHFAGPPGPPPPEYASIPRPRAVYAGSLEAWFDAELLHDVARKLPGVSFVVIGPVRIDLRRPGRLPNVHILGRRPYHALPPYLSHADAGIIPFRRSEHVDAVNPIKLYEYLAAGLPVVVTEWDELRRIDPPAALVRGAAAFAEALAAAVDRPGDPEERRVFARANSWRARFETVRAALGLPTGLEPAGGS